MLKPGPETTPVIGAGLIRKKINETVRAKSSLALTVSPQIASCVFGLPVDSLKNYGLNALIKTDRKGVNILVADDEEIALQALRNWQNDADPSSAALFNKATYVSLYRIVQAAHQGQGKKVARGSESFFLKLLEESDESFAGTLEHLQKTGGFDDEDKKIIHIKLAQIWDALPPGAKDTIADMNPRNLFNV